MQVLKSAPPREYDSPREQPPPRKENAGPA
jgi:hypothetical protein